MWGIYTHAMPYPSELLRKDEHLVLDTRPHWWFVFFPSLALSGALLLGMIVLVNDPKGFLGDAAGILTGLIVLGTLGWFASRYASWISTNFVVTSDRVIFREGVFAKRGIEIPVDKINAVHFDQGVFERLLRNGNVKIESASEQGSSVFENIPKPSAVQSIIYGVVDSREDATYDRMGAATAQALQQSAPASAPQPAPQVSMPEQLEKLHQLKQQGAITDEEYEAQKARLLGT